LPFSLALLPFVSFIISAGIIAICLRAILCSFIHAKWACWKAWHSHSWWQCISLSARHSARVELPGQQTLPDLCNPLILRWWMLPHSICTTGAHSFFNVLHVFSLKTARLLHTHSRVCCMYSHYDCATVARSFFNVLHVFTLKPCNCCTTLPQSLYGQYLLPNSKLARFALSLEDTVLKG
jgi:hypothetical protein